MSLAIENDWHFDLESESVSNLKKTSEYHIEQNDFVCFMNGLQKNSVDLVLTDPPYTISRKTGFSQVKTGVQRFAVSMEFGEWDTKQIDLDKMAQGMYRVLRPSGTAIVWYDLWKISHLAEAMTRAGFKMLRLVVWQKTNPVPLNQRSTYLSNSREVAVVGVKGGTPTFHGVYHNGIYEHCIPRHSGKRIHPTQKPLALFDELVNIHSNRGDLIIDPFLGSGTTAISAFNSGRRFAGCDIDKNYVKAAKARIENV
jgi:DNA modification methylase